MRASKLQRIALIFAILFISISYLYAADNDLEDKDIKSAIEVEMLVDDSVSSHLINVNTEEGIVTLSGSVDSILAKDRAVEIARSIKGVRSVVDQIDVLPVTQTDSQIEGNVSDALLNDPAADSYEIKAQVANGVVTLTGRVDSYAEKQLSEEVAKGVKGVRDIENKIIVDYKTTRPDYEIEADIERRLQSDIRVDEELIDVKVTGGNVKLSGTVGSAEERNQAKLDAWVSGTKSMDTDDLKVKWWARDEMIRKEIYTDLSDEKVEKAVKDALIYDPRVWSFQVNVDASNGSVTLNGTVDNLKAKQAAEEDAKNTIGVWQVKNHIRVRPVGAWTDAAIAESIRDALSRDPYVDRYDINVSVFNSKAYLNGSVDSLFEKNRAEIVASGVNGVIDVQNNLDVEYTPDWRTETWKPDWEIKEDIKSQLFWSPFVDSDEVKVNVDDGVATLTGKVDTWYERKSATDNALEGGAIRVINKLEVDNGSDYWPF
jgi:osmotically-inducible protein OsmY